MDTQGDVLLLCVFVFRLRRAEPSGPDPPAQVLLAGDPDAGADLEVGGSSRKAHLLSGLQTEPVSGSGGVRTLGRSVGAFRGRFWLFCCGQEACRDVLLTRFPVMSQIRRALDVQDHTPCGFVA